MKNHSSPQAQRIAFGIMFVQLAMQFSFLTASIVGTNGNSFIPLSVALLTDGNVCYSGDHPWLSAGSLLCQFEYKPIHFFVRYSQGPFHGNENDWFFPGVDCSLELTAWFLFISQAHTHCRNFVALGAGGHLVYETAFRKGSQMLYGVWRSHLAMRHIFRNQQHLLRFPGTGDYLFPLSTPTPGLPAWGPTQHPHRTQKILLLLRTFRLMQKDVRLSCSRVPGALAPVAVVQPTDWNKEWGEWVWICYQLLPYVHPCLCSFCFCFQWFLSAGDQHAFANFENSKNCLLGSGSHVNIWNRSGCKKLGMLGPVGNM